MATATKTTKVSVQPKLVIPEAKLVTIPGIELATTEIKVVGDSGLISHKWSEKAKAMMLAKQKKEATQGKAAKDPEADFLESLYVIEGAAVVEHDPELGVIATGAKYGFPSVAFKAAAVGACRYVDGLKMTEVRGAFHIQGEFVEIDGVPVMREDMVRVGMGTADIRYRGEFDPWSATLPIQYNTRAISIEQIYNLFNIAGFGVGVGEWRP